MTTNADGAAVGGTGQPLPGQRCQPGSDGDVLLAEPPTEPPEPPSHDAEPAPPPRPTEGGRALDRQDVPPDPPCRQIWQAQALARSRLLRAQWATHAVGASVQVDEQFHRLLATVDALCLRRPTWSAAYTGATVEQTWSSLHAAEVILVAEVPVQDLAGVLPWVADGLRQHLPEDSLQRQAVHAASAAAPAAVMAATRQQAAFALQSAHAASDRAHVRARSFSRLVLIAGLVSLLAVLALSALGAWRPGALPLCDGEASCLTSSTGRRLDVVVAALVGAAAAVVTAVGALSKMSGTSTPYAIPAALAALKVPLGALTAVLGLLVLRAQPGGVDAGLSSPGGLLAWAVALGAAQELFTRLVDLRGQVVLNAVASKASSPPPKP